MNRKLGPESEEFVELHEAGQADPPAFLRFRWRASVERKNGSAATRYEGPRSRRPRHEPTVARAWNAPRQKLQPGVSWRRRPDRPLARRRYGARRRRRSERQSNGFATLPIRCWGTAVRPRTHCQLPKTHFGRSHRDVQRQLVWADLLTSREAYPGPK